MENEGPEHQTKERLRTRWTASLDKIFADLVVEQIQLGNRPKNVFDKKSWGHIRDEFNRQTGLSFNTNQLRKHLDVLRTRYNQLRSASVHNDFSMDDSCCISFDLWDSIGVNPGPEPVKIKDCPIYEQLCTIFADNEADGKYAQSSHYEIANTDAQGLNPDVSCSLVSVDRNLASTEKGTKNNLENNKRKRPLEVNQSGQCQRNREIHDAMAEALLDMIAASKVRAVPMASSNNENFSITNCIKALDEIEGIRESVYFTALDLFEDPHLRETFISLESSERRSRWLQGKCCNASIF